MQYTSDYNPDWPDRFERVAEWLRPRIPAGCVVHHVGSTSIPGMPAKDVIDLDIECPTGAMTAVISALAAFGYEHEGDKGIPTREAFRPLEDSIPVSFPAHHLYACESDSAELHKHLAFRDYLVAHKERASWLTEQKRQADRTAKSRDAYIENKSDAYAVITREALEWAERDKGR
jgi:GrpB-like predicted nucleotidyltransferase (UPF0157 family)